MAVLCASILKLSFSQWANLVAESEGERDGRTPISRNIETFIVDLVWPPHSICVFYTHIICFLSLNLKVHWIVASLFFSFFVVLQWGGMEEYSFKKDVFNFKKDINQKLNAAAHKFAVFSFTELEIVKEKIILKAAVPFSNKICLEPNLNCSNVQNARTWEFVFISLSKQVKCIENFYFYEKSGEEGHFVLRHPEVLQQWCQNHKPICTVMKLLTLNASVVVTCIYRANLHTEENYSMPN